MNKAFPILLLFITIMAGGTIHQASETTALWKTMTYITTSTSATTTLYISHTYTPSTSTVLRTLKGDLTTTFKNEQVNMTHETAAHYPIGAWIFEVPIPPGTPAGYQGELTVTFNYQSPRNITLEQIGIDEWSRIKTASEPILTYYPLATIKIHEGTGSWSTWIGFIHSGETKEKLVFISREGFPKILSIDIAQISKDVATTTSTSLTVYSRPVEITITETVEKTYVITKVTTITTSETTQTPLPTKPTETTITSKPTTTSTAERTEPGTLLSALLVLVLLVTGTAVIIIRRRKKPKPPTTLPSSPPI